MSRRAWIAALVAASACARSPSSPFETAGRAAIDAMDEAVMARILASPIGAPERSRA